MQGSEPKPTWARVPPAVKAESERLLRSRVVRAVRAFGGYAPSATFRLTLEDGRTAFFKGVYPARHSQVVWGLDREARVYRECDEFIRPWAPAYVGDFDVEGWQVLLLEDLGPPTIPPWTDPLVAAAARSYAAFHAHSADARLPDWLSRTDHVEFASHWSELAARGELARTAALAGRRRKEAASWLVQSVPRLTEASAGLADVDGPRVLLHLDTRSDNLRMDGEQLRLFDWNFAAVGPAELDVTAFAQSISAEGGPIPEQFVADYRHGFELRDELLGAAIAGVAGYFADRAWRPDIAGLPRVRSIQRRQLKSSLAWAARHLGLPEPTWLAAVPD